MKNFKSSLLVKTTSTKEFKLPATSSIYTLSKIFSLHPQMSFLYSFDKQIEIHTVSPLNLIKKIEYKKEINDMLITSDKLYILNNESIIVHSNSTFNVLAGDFSNCKLMQIHDTIEGLKSEYTYIGIQSKKELTVFNCILNRISIFKCQCSFSSRDILILGDFSTLKIYIKDKKILEIAMPDYITSIVADPLFSKIYCGTQDNMVYSVSTTGESLKKMEYHKEPVKFMKLSMDGEYIYTADSRMICIWSTNSEVVTGFVELENEIEDLDLFVESDRIYGCIPVLIG